MVIRLSAEPRICIYTLQGFQGPLKAGLTSGSLSAVGDLLAQFLTAQTAQVWAGQVCFEHNIKQKIIMHTAATNPYLCSVWLCCLLDALVQAWFLQLSAVAGLQLNIVQSMLLFCLLVIQHLYMFFATPAVPRQGNSPL